MTESAAPEQYPVEVADARPTQDDEFDALYRAELRYVWNALRRLGAPDADLEDLAHEVFLTAYRRFADYDRARAARPWLFGIALRVAAADRRTARHRHERIGAPDVADAAPGGDEVVERSRARALVVRALASLPIDRRAALVAHDLDGASAPEIARALGVKLNTVYSRIRLARADFVAAVRRLGVGR